MTNEKKAQTIVIAGVGPGLGASLARTFARRGCQVGLFARTQDYLGDLEREIKERNGSALSATVDLTDAEQIAKGFARIRHAFGPIDGLIYHAGLVELTSEHFEHSWRVDV